MVYVVKKKEGIGRVFMVKCHTIIEMVELMRFPEEEYRLIPFTDADIHTLGANSFAVVTSAG